MAARGDLMQPDPSTATICSQQPAAARPPEAPGCIQWTAHGQQRAELPALSDEQMANVDFKPLIDHFSALEYATKYATKQERGSKAFEKAVSLAMNGGGRADPENHSRPAVHGYSR